MLFAFVLFLIAFPVSASFDQIEENIGDYTFVGAYLELDNPYPSSYTTYQKEGVYYYLTVMHVAGYSTNGESAEDYFYHFLESKVNVTESISIGTNYLFQDAYLSPISGRILKDVIWRSNEYLLRLRVNDYSNLPVELIQRYMDLYPSDCFADSCPNLNVSAEWLYNRFFLGHNEYTPLRTAVGLSGFLKSCYERLSQQVGEETGLRLCDNINIIVSENKAYFDKLTVARGDGILLEIADLSTKTELDRLERIKQSCLSPRENTESIECRSFQAELPDEAIQLSECNETLLAEGRDCTPVKAVVSVETIENSQSGSVAAQDEKKAIQNVVTKPTVAAKPVQENKQQDEVAVEENKVNLSNMAKTPQAKINKSRESVKEKENPKKSVFARIIQFFKSIFS